MYFQSWLSWILFAAFTDEAAKELGELGPKRASTRGKDTL